MLMPKLNLFVVVNKEYASYSKIIVVASFKLHWIGTYIVFNLLFKAKFWLFQREKSKIFTIAFAFWGGGPA